MDEPTGSSLPPKKRQGRHPSSNEVYTPITPQVLELLDHLRGVYGTWRNVSAVLDVRLKVLRNMRNGSRKAISLGLMDRITTKGGIGHVDEFVWFTADDMVALGIWKEIPHVRVTGAARRERKKLKKRQARRKRYAEAREMKKRAERDPIIFEIFRRADGRVKREGE